MKERIKRLKENIQNLNDAGVRKTYLYEYVAQSLQKTEGEPIQIRRAKAFAYLLEQVELVVLPHELIAGTMLGMCPIYKEAPGKEVQKKRARKTLDAYLKSKKANRDFEEVLVYDEGHAKSFEEDFTGKKSRWSLMSRVHHDAGISYEQLQQLMDVMEEEYKDKDIEPYEIGRELERAFKIPYDSEIKKVYNKLPWFLGNHLNLNYERMLKTGFKATRNQIEELLHKTEDSEAKEYYESAMIALNASAEFMNRYADALERAGNCEEVTKERKAELKEMEKICRKISEEPAGSFYEAIQFTWMLHIIACIQGGSALSFGRLDQYLSPYYKRDKEQGNIDEDRALELISCLWLKVNEPKMRTVQSVTLGGITPDGKDAVNELTKICLNATKETGMPYPNVGLRINPINPAWIYEEAVETVKAGCGQPMLLNDEVWISNMMKLGYTREHANDYYNMGCVEIMIPGKQPNWGVTEAVAFPIMLESVMEKWEKEQYQIESFEEFKEAYLKEIEIAIEADFQEAAVKKKNMKNQCYDPYASLLIDGCLENGKDMLQDGSECPTHWCVYGYGIGTAADSLCALKKFVFDEKRITLEEMNQALKHNFEGYEELRACILNESPAYGNGIKEVDDIADEILSYFTGKVFDLNKRSKRDKFVCTLFGYFFHIYHGEITGATPDGRRRGEPLSDSMGPNQGRDTKGPTRLLNSVIHLNDENVTGGYALNFKLNPSFLEEEKGKQSVIKLLETYMLHGGPQIQLYTTNLEDLKDAQIHPEKHRDLIVRVGGYCEFFVNLDKALQTEIIHRTLYGEA